MCINLKNGFSADPIRYHTYLPLRSLPPSASLLPSNLPPPPLLLIYLFTWHKMDAAKPFNWPPLQNPRAFEMSLIISLPLQSCS